MSDAQIEDPTAAHTDDSTDEPVEAVADDAAASQDAEESSDAEETKPARPRRTAPALPPVCQEEPMAARVEAVLLSTDRPLSDGRIAGILGLHDAGDTMQVRDAINELNEHYAESGRAFRIESVAGGRQILTLPDFGPIVARLHQDRQLTRLSPAALETLAIVAYRQPILRADVEAIRGVACGEMLRGLMERRLVKITGRAEELGRPLLYGTTREFLRVFGLSGLEDLPEAKELRQPGTTPAES